MKEIILPDERSLTETIRTLNKALLVLKNKSTRDKKQFLADFSKAFSLGAKSVWQLLDNTAKKFVDPNKPDLADPLTVLRDYHLNPYIGSITHGVMFCDGMVIGIQLPLSDQVMVTYRLDYAPDKHLHFNFEIYDGKEKYPLAIPLKFSTGRFGFTSEDRKNCDKNEQKTNTFLEATKLKYWLKMTIAYTLIRAQANASDNVNTPEKQLFDFVRGNKQYDLATIKDYIIAQLPKETGKLRIRACQTELALLECLIQNPIIRAKIRESIFVTIAGQDESARILEKKHHLNEIDITDSDQRLDSDKPPIQENAVRM